MRNSKILSGKSFVDEFARCCREYEELSIAVAWCGNPSKTLPYSYIEKFSGKVKGKVNAIIGVSFYQTHPDAFSWLDNFQANVRVFKDEKQLFHPKIYLFENEDGYAVFIGSSNLTYAGFYSNVETNCLIEGTYNTKEPDDIRLLKRDLALWKTADFSFFPTEKWLSDYSEKYLAHSKKQQNSKIPTPTARDDKDSSANWLRYADWDIYYTKVCEGLLQRQNGGQGYYDVLNAATFSIPTPWTPQIFNDIENRRIIGGIGQYGWLGHIGANGRFRRLLANGSRTEKASIVDAINAIALLQHPVSWKELLKHLNKLTSLGFSMNVWGRVLCITRPDLYCTVSSDSVRKELSETLGIPKKDFNEPEGYIELLKIIHAAPWFNSNCPEQESELETWEYRAALLDAIFH